MPPKRTYVEHYALAAIAPALSNQEYGWLYQLRHKKFVLKRALTHGERYAYAVLEKPLGCAMAEVDDILAQYGPGLRGPHSLTPGDRRNPWIPQRYLKNGSQSPLPGKGVAPGLP